MRVAAIYDIHANVPALEAVFRAIAEERIDRIIVGGDVFPGPMPRESLSLLLASDVHMQFILGNGDREVLSRMLGLKSNAIPEQAREAVDWTAEQLRPEDGRLIAKWPKTARMDIPDLGRVLFCHATPRSDTEIFTRRTPEDRLTNIFAEVNADVVVCGHTHMQFDRRIGKVRVVNAGSVGMPFGDSGAYWLVIGPDVRLMHTPYDLQAAAQRVRATSYPQAQDFAARNILEPPSETDVLQLFSRSEVG